MNSNLSELCNQYSNIQAAYAEIQNNKEGHKKNRWTYHESPVEMEALETQYKEVAKTIMAAAKALKREEITIYQHNFDGGSDNFSFFYGEKKGQERLIPISVREISILNNQNEKDRCCNWPIHNPVINEFFVPVFQATQLVPSERLLLVQTDAFLRDAIDEAEKSKDSRKYRIMEALSPYAQKIYDFVGSGYYNNLLKLFPDQYPKIENLAQ